MTNEEVGDEADSTALARKRRKARLAKKEGPEAVISDDQGPAWKRKKPHITGIKKHARYDPGVQMTREELREWRKEARRVRNRESAAASRKRTRDRISELEEQVQTLETKYAAALARIVELESTCQNDVVQTPQKRMKRQEEEEDDQPIISPCSSAASSPLLTPTVSPVSPRSVFILNTHSSTLSSQHEKLVASKFQHLTDMISIA